MKEDADSSVDSRKTAVGYLYSLIMISDISVVKIIINFNFNLVMEL